MGERIPHTMPPARTVELAVGRFATSIRTDSPRGCQIALLGLPDDTGVHLNHGRLGARDGPTAFRAALARYGVAEPHGWDWPIIFDAGDVIPAEGSDANALHETHRRVTEATSALLDLNLFPIAIGGGHDLTFPFVRAVAQRIPNLQGIYFDAHLDVRDTIGSGMPFRRLIEDCGVGPFTVHALDPFANSREHTAWFLAHGGRIAPAEPPPLLPPLPSSPATASSVSTSTPSTRPPRPA